MGCYDCVCDKLDIYDCGESYCQLSGLSTTNGHEDEGWDCYRGDCIFYNRNRREFVDNILRISHFNGVDFDFKNLKIVEWLDDIAAVPIIPLYVKDFWRLLKKQNFWKDDKDYLKSIKNKKVNSIIYDEITELVILDCEDGYYVDDVELDEKDSEKFCLLNELFFRNYLKSEAEKLDVEKLLMYME